MRSRRVPLSSRAVLLLLPLWFLFAACSDRDLPTAIPTASVDPSLVVNPDGARFTSVSAGRHHTCAVTSDGTVVCWGLGTTASGSSGNFGQSIPPAGTFIQLSGGFFHT